MLRFWIFQLFCWTATVSAAAAPHTIHARTTLHRPLQVQQQQHQQRQAQEESTADGKHIPVIATTDCSEFATRDYLNRNDIPLPCREGDQDDSDAAVNTPPQFAPAPPPAAQGGADTLPGEGGLGSESTSNNDEPGGAADGNRVRITLYVGIRPFRPNIEPIVTAVVTKWLNSTDRLLNMEFFLYDPFVTRQRNRRVQDDEVLGVEGDGNVGDVVVDDTVLGLEADGSESGTEGGGLLLDSPSTIYQQQLEGEASFPTSATTHASIFTLIHFDTESDLVAETNRRWYWRHTVVYDCLYREDRSPVLDFSLLQYVTENVTQALDDSGEDAAGSSSSNHGLTMTLRQRTGDEGVTITIKPEELPATTAGTEAIGTRQPGSDEQGSAKSDPSFPPTDDMFAATSAPHDDHAGDAGEGHHSGVTYTTPLDSQYWDWRRYLGLSLFLGTIVGTFVLSQIQAYRQRRLIKSQVWGNLASEEGVNELLKTGWKLQGPSTKKVMEVYDKSKWGYRENDSMLIGGFEQREAIVGAEITMTHAPSETNTQANISITQDSHHTPPQQQQQQSPYPAATTPNGSVVNASSVHHQYGSPPSSPPRSSGGGGGGSGPSTARKTNNKGSPPLSRSRF